MFVCFEEEFRNDNCLFPFDDMMRCAHAHTHASTMLKRTPISMGRA